MNGEGNPHKSGMMHQASLFKFQRDLKLGMEDKL